MQTRTIIVAAAVAAATLALSSCSSHVHYRGKATTTTTTVKTTKTHGPPPHAPAHGYRHKHGNVTVVFDTKIGVYTVDGRAGYYFYAERYYRKTKSGWQSSSRLNGTWKAVAEADLPGKLGSSNHASKGKGKGKGKGKKK